MGNQLLIPRKVEACSCQFLRLQSHGYTLLHVQTQPVDAAVEGKIPAWLHGSYIRNGPGTFRGMKHLFDGYAMLVKFSFEDGKVLVSQR